MKKYIIPEIITDDFIKEFFTKKDGIKLDSTKTTKSFLDRFPIILLYLNTRYIDSESYLETLYRIVHNIEIRPVCKECGNKLIYHPKHHFRQFCSLICNLNNINTKNKKDITCIQRYGVSLGQTLYIDSIKEKSKNTCLLKYGVEYATLSNIIKEKIKNTNIKRLGVPYTALNKSCLEKMKNTCLERYGVDHNFKIPEVLEHKKQTWLKKYGTEYPMQTKEVLEKMYQSKKQKHTFNSSKIEIQFYDYLRTKFSKDDVYTLYKSEVYPFMCDFYIKSLNLYIEIQGFWAHGYHQFNPNNIEDIKRLNYMKSKNSATYDTAIDVWTVRDVNKRNIAKLNSLNYLEIFTHKVNEAINIFEQYINKL